MSQALSLEKTPLPTNGPLSETEPLDIKLAVWALTPSGMQWARKLKDHWPNIAVYCSRDLADGNEMKKCRVNGHNRVQCPRNPKHPYHVFSSLSRSISEKFTQYNGHLFIMSTGIVVRMIAPLIRHKTIDPAVMVMDDRGQHVISLLSGHIGGANAIARKIAKLISADPVITTATDVNQLPAIDTLATENRLHIENPKVIKFINMAFLNGYPIAFHDPGNLLYSHLPSSRQCQKTNLLERAADDNFSQTEPKTAYVFIDDVIVDLPEKTLILRPRTLVVGIGCNRNTSKEEIETLLRQVLNDFGLAEKSLAAIASVSIKHDEPGLLELSREMDLPLRFFDKAELKQARGIQTPSTVVEKHIGVQSVCEAAAILATRQGNLIVPKHSTPNVTVAVARTATGSTL